MAASKKMPVDEALALVKYELTNEKGGVAFMQNCIDQKDFAALLEFTKTYDQNLRKTAMGSAKSALEGDTTSLTNSVTFDLIGINRSSRPGQENAAEAQRYLDELKSDVNTFLALKRKEVE